MYVKMTEQTVQIADITGSFQVRSSVDAEADSELVENIKLQGGNIKPVILRSIEGGKFEIVAGTRVVPAVKAAGFPTVRAQVGDMTNLDCIQMRLSDTVFNKELSRIDVAHLLMSMLNEGIKQSKISGRLGKSPSWVSSTLKLLETPEATQKAVAAGKISAEAALELEKVPNLKQRDTLTQAAAATGQSVKETIKAVDKTLSRIDTESKATALKLVIEEYQNKIQSAIDAKAQLMEFEQKLAELTLQRSTLSSRIDDPAIKKLAFDLQIVESKIKPLESVIATVEAEISQMKEDCSKIDVDAITKSMGKLMVKQQAAAMKVENAKKALEVAIGDHKAVSDLIKPMAADLRAVETLKKQISSKNTTRLAKKANLDELIEANKATYENYDSIRKQVDEFSVDAEAVMQITQEYTEISLQIPSLRGKANNQSTWEGILKRNESELKSIEQLAK